ncbi:MAG: transglutaminase domain-containing protein [FCB group bacterium]|nr:transglutaminase domain-containing protein [FCB group bacterium]
MKYIQRIILLFIVGLLFLLSACAVKKEDVRMNKHFINPREVELKMTYRISGIKLSPSKTVTMHEFSEMPVSWEMKEHNTKPVLLLYVARQGNYPNQRNMEFISIDPAPDTLISKDLDGNLIEYWDLSALIQDGKDIEITRHFRFTAYETAFKVDPKKVGTYDTLDPLYRYYTRTQEFLELTPDIIRLAEQIVGDERNPWYRAQKIYTWCVDSIDYVYPPDRGIQYCLPRRTGDCGSYSLIFVALCRSVGIPARVANGHWCCAAKKNYHVWNEFYIPGYGWIPADATDGRITREEPGKLAGEGDHMYFFGNLDSGRMISSKGTSIQLYPSPDWHAWGLNDANRNPIFFQTAAAVYANISVERFKTELEIIKGNDILW